MEIVLSSPRGFCAGVVRAIDIVDLCLKQYGAPIYVRREIVHNPHVVNELAERGAIFVDEVEDVPESETIVFSAHGVAPSVWAAAQERNLRIIDASCPLVTKVHNEAIRYAQSGYTILLIGHRNHDEIIGTMGEVPEKTLILENVDDALRVQVPDPEKVVILTQTTLSVDDTKEIVGVLQTRFPTLVTRNDICYATTNRQAAVKALESSVDLILILGARNSSNCQRLLETATASGIPAYLVSGPDELDSSWFTGVQRVGITSGASTPEWLVDSITQRLDASQVCTVEVAEEKVTFALPKELRGVAPSPPRIQRVLMDEKMVW